MNCGTTALGEGVKIRVDNLSFSYDEETVILDRLNFDVHEHEFVTFVGPSGCGKSTLLNVLAGLVAPTRGSVVIDGKTLSGPSQDRTMVFQDDAVFPWYTVEENIEYGLRSLGIGREQRRETVNKFLVLVGLLDDRDKYPRQLSGGMRKRVDLARALAPNPSVVLMDEPFAALDVLTKERLQQELGRIWVSERMTVVFVTHDLEEALFLSQKVMVMSRYPAIIKKIVDVDFGEKRNLDIKTSQDFQLIRRDLAGLLDY